MRSNRLLAGVLGLVASLGIAGAAPAAIAGQLVDVAIVKRSTGERLPAYRHHGRIYVAGVPGEAYALEIANRSGGRVLTVISVDGVNVLTGQTAAIPQSGYVLDPWERYGIAGWRKSMDEVARFVFAALPDSYAARTGRPDNVGVIGVAVFRERPRVEERPAAAPPVSRNAPEPSAGDSAAERDQPAAAAPLAKSESAAGSMQRYVPERLGTGHGERESSPTQYTEFVRARETPDEVISIYYDSRPNLVARGIIPSPRPPEPRPFPGGFVPDPRG